MRGAECASCFVPQQGVVTETVNSVSQVGDIGGVSGDVGGVGRHVVVGGFELRAVNGVSAAGSQVASGDISDFAGGFGAVCGTECCAVSTTEHPAAGRTIESRLLHRCWLQKPYL